MDEDFWVRSQEGPFVCGHCGQAVPSDAPGTEHRNHCPRCLWSLHVDISAGDRRSGCQGPMEPVAIAVRYKGEWALVHRCARCGQIRLNRIAGDDNELALMSLAVRPLAQPAFPLSGLAAGTQHMTTLPSEETGTKWREDHYDQRYRDG